MWAKPSPNRGAARRGPGGSPTASWPGAPGSSSGPGTSGRSSGARTAAIAVAAVLLALLLLSRSGSAKPAAAAAYGAARRPIDAATTALARKGVGSGGGASTTPAATAVPALSSLGAAPAGLPPLFLFVGVLSGRGYRHRRLAVRDSWARGTQNEPESVAKFILSEDEATPQVEREMEEFGDIVYIKQRTSYKSILYKTYSVFEYAVEHFDVRFVLKTDDDAFVHVPPMLSLLRSLCETPGCAAERLYIGRMIQESEVLLQPGHKWNNYVFFNHTGLKTYPKYAMGGGYILSGDVARTLIQVNRAMKLKFTPIEDATLGFWLMAMDLRHVDHERFYTWAASCCFETLEPASGGGAVDPVTGEVVGGGGGAKVKIMDAVTDDLCSADPWLILHKIDSPTKMRMLGDEARRCGTPESAAAVRAAAKKAKAGLGMGAGAAAGTAAGDAATATAAAAAAAAVGAARVTADGEVGGAMSEGAVEGAAGVGGGGG